MSTPGRKSRLQERIEEADRMIGIYAKSVDEKLTELREMISVLCIAGDEALQDREQSHRMIDLEPLASAIQSAILRGFYTPKEGDK